MRLTRMREERKFKLIKYKAQVSSCSSVPYKIIVPKIIVPISLIIQRNPSISSVESEEDVVSCTVQSIEEASSHPIRSAFPDKFKLGSRVPQSE